MLLKEYCQIYINTEAAKPTEESTEEESARNAVLTAMLARIKATAAAL